MIHLIIDGYNLIRNVPSLARQEDISLETGRNHLIDMLSSYKKIKQHKITVIFDGVLNLSEFAPSFQQAGIAVSFSPYGRTADDVIKEMARKEKSRAIVVSSDQSIVRAVSKQGCGTLSAGEFYEKMSLARLMETTGKDLSTDQDGSAKPHKRWTTYKKGPSHRAPKKKRHQKERVKKL